jgi:hypothetical protein
MKYACILCGLAAVAFITSGDIGLAMLGLLVGVTATFGLSVSAGGITIQKSITRTGDAPIGLQTTLNNAQAGTLSTRTDNDTGTITMTSGGHTITTGAVVDIYWSGGVQYSVTVGTVSGTSVPFDAGVGDNLPAETTAVTIVVQKNVNLYIDGDNTKLISICLETTTDTLRTAGLLIAYDAANDTIATIDLVANVPQVWDIEGGSANPFTGDPITYLKVSQGNATTTETYTLKISGVYDATP